MAIGSSTGARSASKNARQAAFGKQFGFLPKTDFCGKKPADPFNVVLEGSRTQVENALQDAGWVPADHLGIVSGIKMVFAFLFHVRYKNAPVSTQDYQGRKEDLAYEKLGPTVSTRDHVRLWDTGHKAADGQDIWVGAATQDVGVILQHDLMPTHKISPDVDKERARLAGSLEAAGVQNLGTWNRTGPQRRINAQGIPYYTDGGVDVLKVGHVPAPPPVVQAESLFRRIGGAIYSLLT